MRKSESEIPKLKNRSINQHELTQSVCWKNGSRFQNNSRNLAVLENGLETSKNVESKMEQSWAYTTQATTKYQGRSKWDRGKKNAKLLTYIAQLKSTEVLEPHEVLVSCVLTLAPVSGRQLPPFLLPRNWIYAIRRLKAKMPKRKVNSKYRFRL